LKFIPSLFTTESELFKFVLESFDNNFNVFNSKLKLTKEKYLRELSLTLNSTSTQELNPLPHIPSNSFLDKFLEKMKSLNKTFEKLHFNLSQESINFKFDFYKSLTDLLKTSQSNLTNEEFKYFKQYIKEKPFKVIDCDKNVGLCLINGDIYNDFVLEQLNLTENYFPILSDPLETTSSFINKKIMDLYNSKDIHRCLFKKLLPSKSSKMGSFRLLAKLHKEKLSFRPIINCISHPTSTLSLLIDCILQPFVKTSTSYLQDSQNLIQITESMSFPKDSKLYSCDFEGLYTNIDLGHALLIITDFIIDNFESSYITTFGFREILKIVFENNIFSFNKKFYKQIRGIAMGSKCGPSIANIYISLLEKNFLTIHKPLLYVRFIDDIFTILRQSFDINILLNNFLYLKLNLVTSKKVVFLDLTIELSQINGSLIYSLYTKPTCTFSYLLYTSNHPEFIFVNIPKSLFIRIRRICSLFSDYLYFGLRLIDQLVSRGYDRTKIFRLFIQISKIDRASLIPYKKKTSRSNSILDKKIFFKLPFDCNLNSNSIGLALNTASNKLRSVDCFNTVKIQPINCMQNNFSSLFVHNKPYNALVNYSYKKCSSSKCIICIYSQTSSFLKLNDFILPILCNASCDSKNVVYIIKCKSCCSFYIGQSEDLYRRLKTHVRFCRLKLSSNTSNCSLLINHFHEGLCNFNAFSFFVFRHNIVNKFKRLNIETQLIHLFVDLGMKVLNDLIPDRYYWYTNAKLFETD